MITGPRKGGLPASAAVRASGGGPVCRCPSHRNNSTQPAAFVSLGAAGDSHFSNPGWASVSPTHAGDRAAIQRVVGVRACSGRAMARRDGHGSCFVSASSGSVGAATPKSIVLPQKIPRQPFLTSSLPVSLCLSQLMLAFCKEVGAVK